MRSLKGVLNRVNQLAEQAQAAQRGDLASLVVPILIAARKRCAAGIPAPRKTDDELRELADGEGLPALLARRRLFARARQAERAVRASAKSTV